MPMYLHQWTYKDQHFRRLLQDADKLDREEVVRTATEAFGGTLHAFYFCFGAFDGVAITEFPDERIALACVMSMYGQGRLLNVQTTPLYPASDSVQAILYARSMLQGGDVGDARDGEVDAPERRT